MSVIPDLRHVADAIALELHQHGVGGTLRMLQRLVVSRALVFACRDRLNYWHTLQELAGIQNFYVEEAIERIIAEQQAALDAEREQLRQEHAEEIWSFGEGPNA